MTMTSSGVSRAPRPSSLADVLDLILDKGLVIDAYVRVSAVGIEVLTIDARIVIASVDTYLHYAEAVNRLDLTQTETQGITGLFGDQQSNGQSSEGQSSNGQASGRSRSGGSRSEGGRSSGGRAEAGRSSRGGSSGRSLGRGSQKEQDEGDGESDEEDEGKGRSLARRLGEKGRWNS